MVEHDIRGSWLTSEVFTATATSGSSTITPVATNWVGTPVGVRMYSGSVVTSCVGIVSSTLLGNRGCLMWTMEMEANGEASAYREAMLVTRTANTAWCRMNIRRDDFQFGDTGGSLATVSRAIPVGQPWRFAAVFQPTAAQLYGGPINEITMPLLASVTGLTDISASSMDTLRFSTRNTATIPIVGDIVYSKSMMPPFRMPRRAVPPAGICGLCGRARGIRRNRRVGTYL